MNQANQTNSSIINAVLSATGKVFVPKSQDSWGPNQIRVMELSVTAETFGFVLSKELCMALSHQGNQEITKNGVMVLDYLKNSVGAHQLYHPMYPNFPAQVINASDMELFVNAIVHYAGSWFGLRILPEYEKIARPILEKTPEPKVIELCSEQDLHNYVENMVSANVSYSPAQRESLATIAKFLQEENSLDSLVKKNEIPNKENLAFWGNLYLQNSWNFAQVIAPRFATTTDVLRLVAAYSNADTSLAVTLRVAKLSRSIRKTFMSLLEQVCNAQNDKEQLIENLLSYNSEWVRISHALHIGEYANKFPESYSLLNKIRNNEKIVTFNSRIEEAFLHGNAEALIENLQSRPGVFARNLTRLLVTEKADFQKFVSKAKQRAAYLKKIQDERNASINNNVVFTSSLAEQLKGLKIQKNENNTVETVVPEIFVENEQEIFNGLFSPEQRQNFIQAFAKVAKNVSTPVLLQVHSHFKNIEDKMNTGGRAIMPKGGLSKMFYQSGSTAKYELSDCQKIESIVQDALIARFATMPSLGKVYIDPALKQQNVPFAMRSASKALKTVARGSTFDVQKDANNVRLFLWWKEPESHRVDIDLSASMYGENFENLGHCSFWNLRDTGFTHSGDIVSAPNGACEFIDIDHSKIPENTAYVVMTLSSYTGQKYCDLPECFAGWMERDNLEEGEIFDARTVKNKIDLSSDTTNIMPIVYDVKNRRMIWVDTSYGNGSVCSNASQNSDAISMILKSWVETHKPTLYDLFEMHAKARGEIVDIPEKADQVFSIHQGVTPYDFDVISSQYMADAN